MEPRCLAHLSGDKGLQKPYLENDDIYINIAMSVYGFERKYCEDKAYSPDGSFMPRSRAKTALLAMMYQTSAYTLGQQLRISKDEAQELIDTFYVTYPDVKSFIENTKQFVLQNGYVEMMFGRKRRFAELSHWAGVKAELERKRAKTASEMERLKEARMYYNGMLRAAVNAVVQGSASGLLKLNMIAIYKLCQKYGWRMAATIHDEVCVLVPETITLEQVIEVERAMTETVKLDVPLRADTVIGPSFGEQYDYREWFDMSKQRQEAV